MLISIETHLTCDFPEGSGHLSPPLDPHMTHLCTKMRSTENNVCVILIDAFLFGIDRRQLCRFVSLSYMVSGLENTTRPLVFTSALGCRASENFDTSNED